MSIFQFRKLQRVIVPAAMAGADNVQGLVVEGHAELGAEPRYILQWPNAEKLSDNGIFVMVVGEVLQSELTKAQPPLMMPVSEASENAKQAFRNGRALALADIEIDRQARAVARKAKRSTRIRKRR